MADRSRQQAAAAPAREQPRTRVATVERVDRTGMSERDAARAHIASEEGVSVDDLDEHLRATRSFQTVPRARIAIGGEPRDVDATATGGATPAPTARTTGGTTGGTTGT